MTHRTEKEHAEHAHATEHAQHGYKAEHRATPKSEHKIEKVEHAHATHAGGKGQDHVISATNVTPEERRFFERHKAELSRTTLSAKWINAPGQHEDHPGQTLATRSHDVIKHWAEERHAVPATVPSTEHGGEPGVLRLNFPGYGGKNLQEILWDQWFKPFDHRDLVFLFQEREKAGNQSNHLHFDSPKHEHD
jgi:hypothetical protein